METIIKKEDIVKMLNCEDRESVGVAEELIGVCRYPDDYWVMPDYYCPGTAKSEKRNKSYELSPVDKLLFNGGFFKEDGGKKYQNVSKELSSEISEIEFHNDNMITLKDVNGCVTKVDFGLLCCIFLKAREMGYEKPNCLKEFGPSNQKDKERWLSNQEKIKELQSEVPKEWIEKDIDKKMMG